MAASENDRSAPYSGSRVTALAAQFTDVRPKPFEASVGRELEGLAEHPVKAFANALGRSSSWVTRMKDMGDVTHIRASETAIVCRALGSVEVVNELFAGVRIGGHLWRMAPIEEAAESEDIRYDSVELAGLAGDFVRKVRDLLADGRLCRVDRATLRAELLELRQLADSLDAGMGEP